MKSSKRKKGKKDTSEKSPDSTRSQEQLLNPGNDVILEEAQPSPDSAQRPIESQVKNEAGLTKTKTKEKKQPAARGRDYLAVRKLVDATKTYTLPEAVGLLKKIGRTAFDQTVELHLTLREKNIRQTVILPHGTGKEHTILVFTSKKEIADAAKEAGATMVGGAELVEKIQKEGLPKVDVVLATEEMMPALVPIAKILGPRGLMPNPKNGTLTNDPASLLLQRGKGTIDIKTEKDLPFMHIAIGKLSMEADAIVKNIQTILAALSGKVLKATLCGTMTPAIKLEV
ncbi:MAG: 50S ribosomal protein L1 [bacterium]|nr:50S ribosomal protein L1 [bacterium]